MQTLPVRVDAIEVGERHRALSDDAVARLTESMRALGLQQPISVRMLGRMEIDGKDVEGVPLLVAGRHRLEAARRLGWSHIDCFEIDNDAITAEMWEIAENLHRCDLTKEQRDEHIRRYAELLDLQSGQVVQNESKRSDRRGHRREETAARVAKATGLSQRTVRRALTPKVRPPAPLSEEDVSENQFRSLMSAWNRAGQEARERFLTEIRAA